MHVYHFMKPSYLVFVNFSHFKSFFSTFWLAVFVLQESDGELEEGEHEATDQSTDGELDDVCLIYCVLFESKLSVDAP